MKKFMDKDFLLENEMAERLYHCHAAKMPIFDYHCHLIPSQIAEDRRFTTITEAWLGGDHYKWRQMRGIGIDERLVTGDGGDWEKFYAWAETMENLVGNPLYHWTHLELQRYFGIYEVLSRDTARRIYDEANRKLAEDPELSVFGIMRKMGVYAVGTTDDPADDLRWHAAIREAGRCPAKVIPSFRPDRALNIDKAGFAEYVGRLGRAADVRVDGAEAVVEALSRRLDFFVSMGCRASDHALVDCPHTYVGKDELEGILRTALAGGTVGAAEADAWRTYLLTELAGMYAARGVAMQLHFAAIRDNNARMFRALGPDTGYDGVHDRCIAEGFSAFMSNLADKDCVPKTVVYSLNPKDYYPLATLMGCYQGGGIPGRIQLGSAWWFCDHKDGMETQLRTLANLGALPKFIGMLTDSRSFLSYPRHEYFRRILCNLLGSWAENGEVPADEDFLGRIVEDISFNNAKRYFEG